MNSNRQIRVFISSTFRDMQAERDHLVKFIFPQLRRLCDSRGVTWGEVDLRWGVTDEQAAEGKVLPICLEEIRRCRPYFVGLLGERYGWIPDTIPSEVIEREPWLKEHLHGRKSVTELEIIHGVLREEKMHGHAFFYFRDPAFIERTSANQRQNFISEDPESADKLHRLKDLIRHAREEDVCCLQENYPTPEVLGELVLKDLTAVIDKLFPEGSQPDPLDHEAMDHEAYAQSRERVYIDRQEYFDRLDTHAAANDTQPLVVLGESGSGKSALLANWVARYRRAHPDALVLQHYIGATPYSADWAAMLRRLMGEFKRRLGIQQDILDQPDALRNAFPNWLYMAAAKGRIVLVLDALNQLEDRDGAPDLVWLPSVYDKLIAFNKPITPGGSRSQFVNHPFCVQMIAECVRLGLEAQFEFEAGKDLILQFLRQICERERQRQGLTTRAEAQLQAFEEIALSDDWDAFDLALCGPAGFDERDLDKLTDHPLLDRRSSGEKTVYSFRYSFLPDFFRARFLVSTMRRIATDDLEQRDFARKIMSQEANGKGNVLEHIQRLLGASESNIVAKCYRNVASMMGRPGPELSFLFHALQVISDLPNATRRERSDRVFGALFGDDYAKRHTIKGLFISGQIDKFDLTDVSFVNSTFADATFADCRVNKGTVFQRCTFTGNLEIAGGERKAWNTVQLNDCTLEFPTNLVWDQFQGIKSGTKQDHVADAMRLALGKFWHHGQPKLTINKAYWNKGTLGHSVYCIPLRDAMLKCGIMQELRISGVSEGGYLYSKDSLVELQRFMDNGQLTGKLRDVFEALIAFKIN